MKRLPEAVGDGLAQSGRIRQVRTHQGIRGLEQLQGTQAVLAQLVDQMVPDFCIQRLRVHLWCQLFGSSEMSGHWVRDR